MNDLIRIDPEDAEELDQETDALLRRWAARKLDVPPEAIARVLVEVTGGCGNGTCEMTEARAEVVLIDGRVFLGPEEGFGLLIRDIAKWFVKPDGTPVRGEQLWSLYPEPADVS
jgi:hypothetical protein